MKFLQRLARDGLANNSARQTHQINNVWSAAGPNIIETPNCFGYTSAPLIIDNMLSLRSKMSESYIYEAVKNSPQKSTALLLVDNYKTQHKITRI